VGNRIYKLLFTNDLIKSTHRDLNHSNVEIFLCTGVEIFRGSIYSAIKKWVLFELSTSQGDVGPPCAPSIDSYVLHSLAIRRSSLISCSNQPPPPIGAIFLAWFLFLLLNIPVTLTPILPPSGVSEICVFV